MFKNRRIAVDVSPSTIFWILFALMAIYFLSLIVDIVILMFTATIVAFAVNPLVTKLDKKKIPRSVSSLFVVLLTFSFFILSAVLLIAPISNQTQILLEKFPYLISQLSPIPLSLEDIVPQIAGVPGKFYSVAVDTLSGFIGVITVIILSFYLLRERPRLETYLKFWFADKSDKYLSMVNQLELQIGNWFRGELVLMTVIGVLAYIGYLIIGLPYALPLALIAGILELVPNLGPVIATVFAAIVGFSISPAVGVGALVVGIIIQQLENAMIVPLVMKKATGVNPIITMLSIMIGFKIGGPLLSVLSIPLVLSLQVIFTHMKMNKHTNIPEIG